MEGRTYVATDGHTHLLIETRIAQLRLKTKHNLICSYYLYEKGKSLRRKILVHESSFRVSIDATKENAQSNHYGSEQPNVETSNHSLSHQLRSE